MRRTRSVPDLVARAREGDPAAVARLITLVEDASPLLREVMSALGGTAGRAHVLGITGAPGVGKSTSTSALVTSMRRAGRRVGVLAIDPSSTVSGGSILGDKTRMADLATRPEAYIRPSPSAGTLGGVARATVQAMTVLEAAGFEPDGERGGRSESFGNVQLELARGAARVVVTRASATSPSELLGVVVGDQVQLFDPLTGALNRRSVMKELDEELARTMRSGRPCSVALIDLDWFKRINDTFGHPAGDEVIRSVARLLRESLRAQDVPGRYGGEEFGVLLPDSAADAAELLTGLPSLAFVPAFGLGTLAITVYTSYTTFASYLKWLTAVLFAYVLAAFLARPDWGQALWASIVPSLGWHATTAATLVAILGTTISPYLFFWQASQEVEEEISIGRRTLEQRKGATKRAGRTTPITRSQMSARRVRDTIPAAATRTRALTDSGRETASRSAITPPIELPRTAAGSIFSRSATAAACSA